MIDFILHHGIVDFACGVVVGGALTSLVMVRRFNAELAKILSKRQVGRPFAI